MPIIFYCLCATLSLENSSRAIGSGIHSKGRCVVLRAVCMYTIFGTFGCIVLYSDTGRRPLCSRWVLSRLKLLMVFWFKLFPSTWSTLTIYEFCFLRRPNVVLSHRFRLSCSSFSLQCFSRPVRMQVNKVSHRREFSTSALVKAAKYMLFTYTTRWVVSSTAPGANNGICWRLMKTGEGGRGASWGVVLLLVYLNPSVIIGNEGTNH